jgi:3-hydroxyisobutyrate dehydrogenase-like beta-hydroxyacid dehydrogenase
LPVTGRRAFHAGAVPDAAPAVKLANNLVLGCATVAMAEGFSLVRKYGVDPQVLYDVMTEGLFPAPAYKGYGKTIVDQTFDRAGSPITAGLKGANLIQAAADLARVPLLALNVYRDRLLGAVAHGDDDKDQAALAREQARACGLDETLLALAFGLRGRSRVRTAHKQLPSVGECEVAPVRAVGAVLGLPAVHQNLDA